MSNLSFPHPNSDSFQQRLNCSPEEFVLLFQKMTERAKKMPRLSWRDTHALITSARPECPGQFVEQGYFCIWLFPVWNSSTPAFVLHVKAQDSMDQMDATTFCLIAATVITGLKESRAVSCPLFLNRDDDRFSAVIDDVAAVELN